ncbi:telomeric repeat-binding factor 1 [Kryptolebias marmoratus]|uniref:Telomeric repeat-binding factor n=1 Tax=Kryptolebias marmoratus TaxID=37003 RepID=A0A3Q3ADT3_KRYMA|nr:telomeric repeat-binding factor 1 [Kryptolebias marmoratus]
MESDVETRSSSKSENTDESVSFSRVTAVATEWMVDFLFVSLCRRFQEGNLDEFNETLSVLQAISQGKSIKGAAHKEKLLICAFLTRVMSGKELDVLFEADEAVMPLMSAANVWSNLESAVDDERLFKNISVHLLVQSVAVCLEKGQKSLASSALKWFEKSHECPRNLEVKLSTIVTKMETYHPFLLSFSFDHLLEMIESFLDSYLKKNPSDYLLKAAADVVQSSQNMECLEDVESPGSNPSESPTKSVRKNKKTKRKLLPSSNGEIWVPDATKKPRVSVERLYKHELSQMMAGKSLKTHTVTSRVTYKRKTHQKWTPLLDKCLKEGVKRHGVGKWALILKDHDFQGRTGTMLKDRWRVLLKAHEVG